MIGALAQWWQDPVVVVGSRLAVALLFATAASHKLRNFVDFRDTVENYDLLPAFLLAPAAVVVIGLEVAIVAALLYPPAVAAGSTAAIWLLLCYMFAIGINLARGRRSIDCGCGGRSLRQPISEWLVLRNLLLVGVAWLAGGAMVARDVTVWDYLLGLLALATFSLLYIATEHLLANAPRLRRLISAHD